MDYLSFQNLDDWLEMLAAWVGGLFNGGLSGLAAALVALANWVESLFRNADLYFWAAVVSNMMIILAYIPVKRVMLTVFRFACNEESALYGWCAGLVYKKQSNGGMWCVKPHMEQGITLTKTLHAKLNQRFTPTPQADARILGVAIRDKKKGYTILLENGSPRLSATMAIVHELTHIWQYLNWDDANICKLYGKQQHLQIYEGMAKWVEIQYAYLINERATAKREEIITRLRQDEYGIGFLKYADVYPLSYGTRLLGDTPFANPQKPL